MAAACQRRLALRARRVLGADDVGAARPGACGEPDHRLALRARRRGRCAPVHRAGQPLAAIADSRYALSAEGVGAARPVACGSRVAASRYALGAEGVGAARPGAYMLFPPPITARVASWWWGCRRRRALRAARDARCKARFALLPRARVGWHAARTSLPPLPPRSSGAPAQWLTARGRRASGVAAAPRSRAAGAPAARGRRALGGARACRAIQTSALGRPWSGPPSGATRRQLFSRARLPHSVDWVSICPTIYRSPTLPGYSTVEFPAD